MSSNNYRKVLSFKLNVMRLYVFFLQVAIKQHTFQLQLLITNVSLMQFHLYILLKRTGSKSGAIFGQKNCTSSQSTRNKKRSESVLTMVKSIDSTLQWHETSSKLYDNKRRNYLIFASVIQSFTTNLQAEHFLPNRIILVTVFLTRWKLITGHV